MDEASLDPVTHSVITNALDEIAAEMDEIVVRTARNLPIVLAHDFSVGLTDGEGRLIGGTQGIPVHLGSIDMTVQKVIELVPEIRPGDVVLTNDPYRAANTHMPDFTMVSPVYGPGVTDPDPDEGPVLYMALRADQADIGAKDPVRSPVDTEEAYNDGLIVPPVKVVRDGEVVDDVIGLITRNSRVEKVQRGDLSSMIGAIRKGEERSVELLERYGVDTVRASTGRLLSTTEEKVREYVADLPDGTYHGHSQTDASPKSDDPVHIRVAVTVDGEEVTFDFEGSSEQIRAPINNTIGVTHSAVNSAWFVTMGLDIPFNAGCVDVVDVHAPMGSIVNPEFPYATGYSTVDCVQETMEACLDALTEVNPENAPAGWSRWVRPMTSGTFPDSGEEYRGAVSSVMGGGGAVWGRDGMNAIGGIILLGGFVGIDPEMFEAMYPMSIEEMDLRTDSGGAGRWRGGLGPTVAIAPDGHESIFSVGGDFGRASPPHGHLGGRDGDSVRVFHERASGEREELERSWTNLYITDGRYVQESGGGGGVGDPHERDPEKVRRDVKDGYVSREAAREEYGVVLTDDLGIDREATGDLRGDGDE